MYKFLIISLIFVSAVEYSHSQNVRSLNSISAPFPLADTIQYTFQQVDSMTYQCYTAGNWDKLIQTGVEAIKQKIEYKILRQRMGYAWFMKADYYAAMNQYEAALKYDKADIDTRYYLYYCGLYTGNESYARYQLSKLPAVTQKNLNAKPFKIVDAVDAEYNFKTNDNPTRYNANYGHLGITTKLGYRFSLYQAASTFSQRIDSMGIKQNEYFARLNWAVTSNIDVAIGYHYINSTTIDSITYRPPLPLRGKRMVIFKDTLPGNLFYSKISVHLNRFEIGVSGSVLNYNKDTTTMQYGLYAGVTLPGKLHLNLKSALYYMYDPRTTRLIFSQTVGALMLKNVWVEGNITFGNLKNYSESDGLYVYNTDDPTIFKTGLTLYWNVTPNICFLGNYTYNTKLIEKKSTTYNQQSFSTGIIWKI